MIANIFGEGFLPARPARYGLARRGGKEEGEAEQLPHLGRHSTGSRRATPECVGLCAMGRPSPRNLLEALTPVKLSWTKGLWRDATSRWWKKPPWVGPGRRLGPDVSMKRLAQMSPWRSTLWEPVAASTGNTPAAGRAEGGHAPRTDPGTHGGQRSAYERGGKADHGCQCTIII